MKASSQDPSFNREEDKKIKSLVGVERKRSEKNIRNEKKVSQNQISRPLVARKLQRWKLSCLYYFFIIINSNQF